MKYEYGSWVKRWQEETEVLGEKTPKPVPLLKETCNKVL
jgi:hypothetical protein